MAYFERLKDLIAVSALLERLLITNLEDFFLACYVLYKIYKEQKSARAQAYKDQLVSRFPDSYYNQYIL